MKYFAHLCTAQDDDKFDILFEKYSFEGYGVFWWLCEHVGRRKKTANDNPEYLFSTRRRTLERGMRRDKLARIIHFIGDQHLIEVQEEPDWLVIKIPKLNAYSAEWQKRLAKANSGETREQLRTDSVSTPTQLGPEEKEYKRKKRKKDLTLAPSAVDAAEEHHENLAPPDALQNAMAEAGLNDILTGKGNGSGKKEHEKPKIFTLPEDLDAHQDSVWKNLAGLGILPQDQVDNVAAAMFSYLDGKAEAHDVAALLDNIGVTGADKVKIYAVMG